MPLAICTFYCAPLMSSPHHKSEMETQILFGETVEIIDSKGIWILVRASWDSYEGWVLKSQFQDLNYKYEPKYFVSEIGGMLDIKNANIQMPLPFGALLCEQTFMIGEKEYSFDGQIKPLKEKFSEEIVTLRAKQFINTPYMWGGRTHAGIDCSGYSTLVYKCFGIALKHDASWQMTQGQTVDFLQNALAGDLAFFDNEYGEITHVGILLNSNTIIHATETTGGVTIDTIDQSGITSNITKRHTHNLRIIKRLVQAT
jgi:gamma-D-glutamyl-L-lysine dipeptidyl-peptidase